jgi:hypothetical protein
VICEQRQELPVIPNVIGMLSHQQYSHVLHSKWHSGLCEVQSREYVNFIKKHSVHDISFLSETDAIF